MQRNEQNWRDNDRLRARRPGRNESLVDRIKNDVKSWFDDDDSESDRDEYAGYGSGTNYGGSRYARRQNWDQDYDRFRNRGQRSRFGRRTDEHDDDGFDYDDTDADNDYRNRLRSGGRSQDLPVILYSEYWVTPGPHSGVGPKGYERSPDALKERVCERLEGHGELDASEIEVTADSEEITLSGEVCSRHEKRLAEDCAESVYGVRDIHNRLTVKRRDARDNDGTPRTQRTAANADKRVN